MIKLLLFLLLTRLVWPRIKGRIDLNHYRTIAITTPFGKLVYLVDHRHAQEKWLVVLKITSVTLSLSLFSYFIALPFLESQGLYLFSNHKELWAIGLCLVFFLSVLVGMVIGSQVAEKRSRDETDDQNLNQNR